MKSADQSAGTERSSTAATGTPETGSPQPALLEQGARLFEFLLDSAGDGIFDWDLQTNRIRYSKRMKMLLGYDDHEFPDEPDTWRKLTHPDDLPGVDEELRLHIESLWPFIHSWRMRHHNGSWRWILCRAKCESDGPGKPRRLLALFTDIQDQVTAEERQKALLTALPDRILRLDRGGVVLDEKRAAGGGPLLPAVVVGQSLVAAVPGAEIWPREAVAAVREAIDGGEIVERECIAAAGQAVLELRVVRSGPDEAICIVRDITERRRAEQRQLELMAQVEAMREAERKRLVQELKVAEHIQMTILPKVTAMPTLDVGCQMWPAAEVGGDYFDVLPCPDGAWLAIGDVSGHGVNAGMIMLMAQSAIASLVTHDPTAPPSTILRTVNKMLRENIRGRMDAGDFMTCTLLRYWNDGRLLFAGAHEDMVVLPAGEESARFVPTPGAWLGVLDDLSEDLVDTTYRLRPGDLLVLFSDGITEARNAEGVQFGPHRLAAAVAAVRDRSPSDIRDHVRRTVKAWSPVQDDDMSLVVARHRPPAP